MNRVYPQWIFVLILTMLIVLNLGIALVSSCGQGSVQKFAQGPYCAAEHTSTPIQTEKSTRDIAIAQEFSIFLSFFLIFSYFSPVLVQKNLPRGFITWRKAVDRDVKRAGPSSFGIFIPQVFATRGA